MDQDQQHSIAHTVDAQGEDLDIRIASGVEITTPLRVRGRRNRLILGEGTWIGPYIPSGLSAFDHDPGAAPLSGLVLNGEDNSVEIGAGVRLGVNLTIQGSGNRVVIGRGCNLRGLMNLLGSQGRLTIGAETTMVQGSLQLHEAGEIRIGDDCMISSQVYIALSDIHPIYDRQSGQRINPAASVIVGDHVWLGLRSMVLKGSRIGAGAVVAAGAMVSGQVPANTIVAGTPARVIRENVEWRRDLASAALEPQDPIARPPRKGLWSWRGPR